MGNLARAEFQMRGFTTQRKQLIQAGFNAVGHEQGLFAFLGGNSGNNSGYGHKVEQSTDKLINVDALSLCLVG